MPIPRHAPGLRVEARRRETGPRPWVWEIYRGDEPLAIKRSVNTFDGGRFSTQAQAFEAGQHAMSQLRAAEAKKPKELDA